MIFANRKDRVHCKVVVRRFSFLFPILLCGLIGCEGSGVNQAPPKTVSATALRSPSYDTAFRAIWDDGAAEVSTYTTERMRGGSLRKGTATVIISRATFSEDDRVAELPNGQKSAQQDLFPALQMNWMERYSMGPEDCGEMTTSVVALSKVEGRPSGTQTKTDFSAQSWDGQLFHQLLFDATGVRSHQYSFQKEGDEQSTLPYPREGVSADALWFCARGLAAPLLDAEQQRAVELLPRLRDVRERRSALSWKKATLTRRVATGKTSELAVVSEDGLRETFVVEKASPNRVLHWEDSEGEHAELVNSSRMKSWEQPAALSRK